MPEAAQLPERLASVLRVIYLVFNEGYSASSGDSLTRSELSNEAIRLARLLRDLLPEQAEIMGILALMLLHESRRTARVRTQDSTQHDLIPLDEQDRSLWHTALIDEGCSLAEQALRTGQFGIYSLQAAISAVHAEAKTSKDTDWIQIIGLYDALFRLEPSAIVSLNRAVAVAMHEGPARGLSIVTTLLQDESMRKYHLAHAAQADMYRRLAYFQEAKAAYEQALSLSKQGAEQRFLKRRIAEMQTLSQGIA